MTVQAQALQAHVQKLTRYAGAVGPCDHHDCDRDALFLATFSVSGITAGAYVCDDHASALEAHMLEEATTA